MRSAYFKKDERLEKVLKEINELTADIVSKGTLQVPQKPIVLIVGCPRTGGTLLFQWLASLGLFSYPSNLIARFYSNPWLGIKIQQALLEFDPINQLDFNLDLKLFHSQLGKTEGALNPSEYWYFWRQYFGEKDEQRLTEEQLRKLDMKSLLTKLSGFHLLTGKPLVMKGNLMNEYLLFLHQAYPKFIFINLAREPFYSSQSLLFAREKFFGTRESWYSAKPREYSFLQHQDPISQVAGQIIFIQKSIRKALQHIPEVNKIQLTYEGFCKNPYQVIDQLVSKFEELGQPLDVDNLNKEANFTFDARNTNKLSKEESSYLKNKLNEFQQYG